MKKLIHLVFWLVAISTILILFYSHVAAADAFQSQRNTLVDVIKADVVATSDFLQQKMLDGLVLEALRLLNGFAAVISAILPTVIAMNYGFNVLIFLAIGLYCIARKCFPNLIPLMVCKCKTFFWAARCPRRLKY